MLENKAHQLHIPGRWTIVLCCAGLHCRGYCGQQAPAEHAYRQYASRNVDAVLVDPAGHIRQRTRLP